MYLLRSSGHEQRVIGGGQSLPRLLSRDAGGGNNHQLRTIRQPASHVRVINNRTDARMFSVEYIFNCACGKIAANKWHPETDYAFLVFSQTVR